MPENSGNITCDYMYLWVIVFHYDEVENLHLQYSVIRKIEWDQGRMQGAATAANAALQKASH